MMNSTNPQFSTQQDVYDMAALLMRMNHIPSGRQLAWLAGDKQATSNRQLIEYWLQNDMYQQLCSESFVDIFSISESLQDYIETVCDASISEALSE